MKELFYFWTLRIKKSAITYKSPEYNLSERLLDTWMQFINRMTLAVDKEHEKYRAIIDYYAVCEFFAFLPCVGWQLCAGYICCATTTL